VSAAPATPDEAEVIRDAIRAYYVRGERRHEIAARTNFSARQIQSWLSGETRMDVTRPLLAELHALGLAKTKLGGRVERLVRAEGIATAALSLCAELIPDLIGRPGASRAEARFALLVGARP